MSIENTTAVVETPAAVAPAAAPKAKTAKVKASKAKAAETKGGASKGKAAEAAKAELPVAERRMAGAFLVEVQVAYLKTVAAKGGRQVKAEEVEKTLAKSHGYTAKQCQKAAFGLYEMSPPCLKWVDEDPELGYKSDDLWTITATGTKFVKDNSK
jgi:hypothetical protein